MSVTMQYKVHNVSGSQVPVSVPFEGAQVKALVDSLEVELTSDSRHGSTTLRFVGAEIAEAKETFLQDATVELTFKKVDSAPAS